MQDLVVSGNELDGSCTGDLNSIVNVLLPSVHYEQPASASETLFCRIRAILVSRKVTQVNKDLLFSVCNIISDHSTHSPEKILPIVLSRLHTWRVLTVEEKLHGLEKLALDLSEIVNHDASYTSSIFPRLRIRWIGSEYEDPLADVNSPNLSETANKEEVAFSDAQDNVLPISHPRNSFQVNPRHENASYRSGCYTCHHPRGHSGFPSAGVEEFLGLPSSPRHSEPAGSSCILNPEVYLSPATHQASKTPADENIPPALFHNVQKEDPVKTTTPSRSLPLPWPLPPADVPLNSHSSANILRRSTRLSTKAQLQPSSSLSKVSASSSRSSKSTPNQGSSLPLHVTHRFVPRRKQKHSSTLALSSSSSYNSTAVAVTVDRQQSATIATAARPSASHLAPSTSAPQRPGKTTNSSSNTRSSKSFTSSNTTKKQDRRRIGLRISKPKDDNERQGLLPNRSAQAS